MGGMNRLTLDEADAAAVEAVAEWLCVRDGLDFHGLRAVTRRSEYRRRAAALLAGEQWAQLVG